MVLIFAGVFFSVMCLFLPVSGWLKALLILAVLLFVARSSWQYALLRLPHAVVAISVNKANQLHVMISNGQQFEMRVQKSTVVTAYLTVLNCVPTEAILLQRLFAIHIVILPDAVNAEHFRQLRIWLRWAKVNTEV